MTDVYTELLQENSELKTKVFRLEQENKELKKQIESQKGLITVGGKQQYEYLQKINELEQENKELKTEKLYRGIDKQFIEDANDKLYWENKQYRSALEEIKKLAVTGSEQEDCYSCEEIVWKIDEVLDDNQAN